MQEKHSRLLSMAAWIWVVGILAAYMLQFRPILAQLVDRLWKA